MKRITPLFLVITVIFLGCGGGAKDDNANTADSKIQVTEEKKVAQEMTVEKYAKMDFELASMLMEKHYDKLKGKEYEEVKDIYYKFLEDKASIYKKYNITDPQDNSNWARKNKVKLKAYREAHPEINYFKKYPDFKEAYIVIYNLARAEYNSKKTEE
jgi:hypothetical protein